ncbi:Wzz/FepE/Etk N-terminal domain-containing protein [Gammaproteobacteria bacterium]|nr:Wzz/FepE/Etk N-terminal domain-containing protein [Gammaproteobacteria bacterium]
MREIYNNKHLNQDTTEIDLWELFRVLFQGKWIIVSFTTFASIFGIIYSLQLPNIYQSKALLVPVDSSTAISGALGNYGGLAGLAGINIPSGSGDTNDKKAIKKLSSLSFFENNILPNIFLPDLMAIKSWNPVTNTIEYDDAIYDSTNDKWTRDYSYPKKQIPSAQESFGVFVNNHLTIDKSNADDFITLSIRHQSPFIAKKWAELIVYEVNSFYRQKDKTESEKAVRYLKQQISMTTLSEIKQVIAELLQEETQKLSLIEANEYYVLDFIDPPAVMEQKSEPKRSIICLLSAFFGGLLGIVIILLRHYGFRQIET